jgi:hypothetical protein
MARDHRSHAIAPRRTPSSCPDDALLPEKIPRKLGDLIKANSVIPEVFRDKLVYRHRVHPITMMWLTYDEWQMQRRNGRLDAGAAH